ncbi:hypothetical protein [Kitasatospora sp. NPDC057223]|uniref:hypothetical protein n=1 Tax=Kitasatospora sp. NPDC057223 TaxID=3346055 RepID=UPI00362E1C64
MTTAGGRWTAGLWAALTMLCLGAAGIALLFGLSLVAPHGSPERATISACETRHSARNNYVQCEALLTDGTHISLRRAGHPGGSVDAVRAPWGSYIVPWKGFTAWTAALAAPLTLLVAAAACAVALRKAVASLR